MADLPVDGYIRVSRVGDREGESYISPDVQASAIARLAAEHGLQLVMHPAEENESGGSMDRPIFNRVMERIRAGESGGILVYTLDRFARDLVGGYTLLTEIAARGAVFASATEPQFDFVTATGRMFMQMQLMLAEYFRERTKENWAVAVQTAVSRGVHPAPYGAYGYDRVAGRLVPNDAAPFVVKAFRLRVDDRWTYGRIAEWLNEHAPPHIGSDGQERPWTGPSVQRMLARRVYLGEAFYGVQVNTTGRDPYVNPDAHDVLPGLDEDLWLAAQRPIHTHSKKRGDDSPEPLLQGMVRCAGCRYVMSAGYTGSEPYRRRQYRCRGRHVSGTCEARASVVADRLETYVEQLVCAQLDQRAGSFSAIPVDQSLEHAQARLAAARKALDEMRQDTAARQRLGARWLSWVEPYLDDVEAAERELAAIRARSALAVHGVTSEQYMTLSRGERRIVLADLVDVVMVRRVGGPRGPHAIPLNPDRVIVLWHGQAPADLPLRSRFANGVQPFPWPTVEHDPGPGVARLEQPPERDQPAV